MGDPAIERLAGRPPLTTLLGLTLRLGVVGAVGALDGYIAAHPRRSLVPGEPAFWFRVAMLALVTLFAVWCLLGAIRVIRRWLSGTGIWIAGDELRMRVPGRVSSWNPGLRVQERTVPLASVQAIEHDGGEESAAIIKTADGEVIVPSGTFAIGGYDLDQVIRARVAAAGGELAAEPPLESWRASTLIRLVMIPASLAAFVISFAMILVAQRGGSEAPRIFFLPFVLGLALLILPFVYRGLVVVDRRGIFHQRDGKVTFLPWSVLPSCRLVIQSQLPGWSTMAIKKGRRSWFHLTRLFGLGFPLRKIGAALQRGPNPPAA